MNPCFKSVSIVAALLLSLLPVRGQGAFNGRMREFVKLTVDDGLASNNVYDVCKDGSGCIWMATNIGLSRYDGISVTNYFKEDMTVRSSFVSYVYCDSRGRIWAGTDNGVAIYDPQTGKFTNLELLTGLNIESQTAWFFESSDGTMWISFKKHGILSVNCDTFAARRYFYDWSDGDSYFSRIWLDTRTGLYLLVALDRGRYYAGIQKETMEPFRTSDTGRTPFAGKNIKGLIRFDDSTFYLTCTDGTLWTLNPYERTCSLLPVHFPDYVREVRRISRISESLLAIVTTQGLFIYDLSTSRLFSDKEFRNYQGAYRGKSLHCIAGNMEDGLLLGFHGRGLAIQQESGLRFRTVRLQGSEVSGFAEASDNTVWVSTRRSGLYRFDPAASTLEEATPEGVPDHLDGVCLCGDCLWTWSGSGVYRINPETMEADSYLEGGAEDCMLVPAPQDRLSMLTRDGLFEFDPRKDAFVPVSALSGKTIWGIARSSTGDLIVHADAPELLFYDGRSLKRSGIPSPERSTSSYLADVIHQDESSRVWISPLAQGVFIGEKKGLKRLSSRSGLYSDVVSNIVSDPAGGVVITTDRSLSVLPPSGRMLTFTKSDGLLNFGFSRNASLRLRSGEVLLGSRDGFIRIPPSHNLAGGQSGVLTLSGVHADGAFVPVRKGRVSLGYRQNSFEIGTQGAGNRQVNARQTFYCLEGYDDTWIPIGEGGRISFVHIPPGRYRLLLYGQKDPLLTIRVRPHPLRSVGAGVIYAMLLLVLAIGFITYVLSNERRKREANILQMKIDLHKDKMDFFTGIAHEIKTPLTLITTPLNHVLSKEDLDADTRYDLEVISKNASYLSTLVKELMELSKIEDKKYLVNCVRQDLRSLLENVRASFSEQLSGKDFRLELPDGPIWVMADDAATMKIFNNLMLNAVKYSDKFIGLTVGERDGMAMATFLNDGAVIPPEVRKKVFELFTQYSPDPSADNDGFGIGLSVARALAGLQGGDLVISPREDMNEFVLTIPLCPEGAEEEVTETESAGEGDGGRKTLLIVEDHSELVDYLGKVFKSRFAVLKASNGREAFNLITSRPNIDLVISDIRMPVMDGLELCAAIKGDITYSHIPVILLSANLTPQVQITALEKGADAMVDKPFSVEYLLSVIDNIFASRARLLESVSNHPGQASATAAGEGRPVREALFLDNLSRIISENLADPDFGVDELAVEMEMSQGSLNRKIRDIYHSTTGNLIRDRRLEQAERLLKTTSLQINEICYKVGFQTPSYFIKCFRAKYGLSPNEFAKSVRS